MSADKIGVWVATPMRHWMGEDALHPHFKRQLQELAAMNDDPACPYHFTFSVVEGGLIIGRNKLAAAFLASGAKWLVAWDDDIEATAADVLKLLSHKRPVVAGMYCRREARSVWVCNFMHEVELQKGGLLQVIESGIGFKCYHREVFTELARIYPEIAFTERESGEILHGYFQNCAVRTDLKPDGDWLSEDYFCDYLCRMARIGMFVDTTIRVKHRGKDGTLYPEDWPPIPGIDQ